MGTVGHSSTLAEVQFLWSHMNISHVLITEGMSGTAGNKFVILHAGQGLELEAYV